MTSLHSEFLVCLGVTAIGQYSSSSYLGTHYKQKHLSFAHNFVFALVFSRTDLIFFFKYCSKQYQLLIFLLVLVFVVVFLKWTNFKRREVLILLSCSIPASSYFCTVDSRIRTVVSRPSAWLGVQLDYSRSSGTRPCIKRSPVQIFLG